MSFEQTSHNAHQNWHEKLYPDESSRRKVVDSWKAQTQGNTINRWLHERLLSIADPFATAGEQWLTVGDAYGMDGNYLVRKGCEVTATDISGTFLPFAQAEGYIQHYSVENVEHLSFSDAAFDYVLCKESYHHFPRPHVGVYEMLRVARKGVVLVEPQDPIARMPLLLAMRNLFDRVDPTLLGKFWKNRYSFEEVGNYVFKLSEREIEKLAMAINLPAVAFKGLNNNYYNAATANTPAEASNPAFRSIQNRLKISNALAWLSVTPYQILGAVILKQLPDSQTAEKLKAAGFAYYVFPKNPYV
ncbi:MAG: class I SAM-dependent methyltransferase [Spirosomataceae bacterium]